MTIKVTNVTNNQVAIPSPINAVLEPYESKDYPYLTYREVVVKPSAIVVSIAR